MGTQQRARFLKANTIGPRLELVRRFAAFSNQYPWQWESAEAEAFIDHLPGRSRCLPRGTTRTRCGCSAASQPTRVTGGRRGAWSSSGRCRGRSWMSGTRVAHVTEFEGQPHRRPLTYDEVQALFDAADGRVEQIRSRGRKGALAAQRDAALLKVVYAFGLRRREAWGLDLADLRRNPQVPQFARLRGGVRPVG